MIDVVDIAIGQLGVKESGGPNNGLPFQRFGLPGEQPLAWCARFVRWCFTQAGHRLPGNPYEIASVTNLHAALVAAGAWRGPEWVPRRGNLILLNERGLSDVAIGGRHVGLVERADAAFVCSVDGNWGDAVKRVPRRLEAPEIWGYAEWPLPAAA